MISSHTMPHIAIISGSIRTGRKSHRVATFFKQYLTENNIATAEILDLQAYNFPIFEERLKVQEKPSAKAIEFAKKVREADGIIFVCPEYNGAYPASVKNVIDLLNEEWKRKPVALCTVSGGVFGGMQSVLPLQFSLWKLQAWVVTAMFPVQKVTEAFTEAGEPTDKAATEQRANGFVNELLWCVEANRRMAA